MWTAWHSYSGETVAKSSDTFCISGHCESQYLFTFIGDVNQIVKKCVTYVHRCFQAGL